MNQTREEQKAVLDAAWNGEECQYYSSSRGGWEDVSLDKLLYLVSPERRVVHPLRIKPKPDPYAELKAAHAEGKVIQGLYGGHWVEIVPDCPFRNPVDHYRIRPEPITVPLEAKDIPAVCWLRSPSKQTVSMITHFCENDPCGPDFAMSFEALMDGWEYSSDRVEWKPCHKLVEQ